MTRKCAVKVCLSNDLLIVVQTVIKLGHIFDGSDDAKYETKTKKMIGISYFKSHTVFSFMSNDLNLNQGDIYKSKYNLADGI